MDTKTNERIMEAIFKLKKPANDSLSAPVSKLLKELPDLNEILIKASIDDLSKAGHLKIHQGGNEILSIIVMPSASGYDRELQAQRDIEAAKKFSERKWELIKMVLGHAITFIFGFISATLFNS